ncbi:NifU family protein [Aureibaculum marinum]|nr:NifU family protein [Aureibaculum marinum]
MLKIHIESTKTPTIVKFVSNKILTEGSFEYNSVDDVNNSSFIQQLFHLPFVKKVFVTANFIAIERFNIVEWADVQDELKSVIENYLTVNESLFNTETETKKVIAEIYAESTPNPAVMKFVSNKLLTSENIEVISVEEAKEVPIANDLFDFPFVKEVFIANNYVSITKNDTVEWFEVTTALRDFLKNYLSDEKPIISNNYIPITREKTEIKPIETENLDDISKEIIAILDEYIKPAVTSDGGNIMFQSYDTNSKTVSVILQGACSGCPSSTITLKNGIEATLKQLLPDKIGQVVALNG